MVTDRINIQSQRRGDPPAAVHRMTPVINVALVVRFVVADDYEDAKVSALAQLLQTEDLVSLLYGILRVPRADWQDKFNEMVRVAREVDGTYTVTLP